MYGFIHKTYKQIVKKLKLKKVFHFGISVSSDKLGLSNLNIYFL